MPETDTVLVEPGEELFRETRVEYSWDRQPTHQSRASSSYRGRATLLHQMEQGIGQMAMRDASPTTPPSHNRVLIWRAIAMQGILRQALTRMRIDLHMLYIEVLLH